MSRKPATRQGHAINYLGWNTHIGTDFDDFLAEQDLADEVGATALKRVIFWQLAATMKLQRISKKTLAERMQTSRTTVDGALGQIDAGQRRPCTGPVCL